MKVVALQACLSDQSLPLPRPSARKDSLSFKADPLSPKAADSGADNA